MNRWSFEAIRLGALLVGAAPFLLTDPASVWWRRFAFAWLFILTVEVGALCTLWYKEEDDEHDYPLFIFTLIPLFLIAGTWCGISCVLVQIAFGTSTWDLRHVLLFCLPAGYVFPFLMGAVPQAVANYLTRRRFARR